MASERVEEPLEPPESFLRFQRAMKRILTVSKEESDAQIAAAKAERKRKWQETDEGPQ